MVSLSYCSRVSLLGFRHYRSQVCSPIVIDFGQHVSLSTLLLDQFLNIFIWFDQVSQTANTKFWTLIFLNIVHSTLMMQPTLLGERRKHIHCPNIKQIDICHWKGKRGKSREDRLQWGWLYIPKRLYMPEETVVLFSALDPS